MTEEEKKSKEDKSRNPNPKTPTMMGSEKKTKKQIFEERFGEYNDKPFAKLSKGGLKGNQKKLDKNNNNRIDSEDFKILRGGRAAMKANKGKLGEAKDYKKYLQGLKQATMSSKAKKVGEAAAKVAKSTKLGKIALGVAGAGIAAKKFIESDKFKNMLKKKMNKKMGGGMMMQKPMMANKGVMAKAGKTGYKKLMEQRAKDRKTDRDKARAKDITKGMGGYMGGGMMMKKPMAYYGGGMMMRPNPVGMKSGKSVKVKCKLGKNKPTKMY